MGANRLVFFSRFCFLNWFKKRQRNLVFGEDSSGTDDEGAQQIFPAVNERETTVRGGRGENFAITSVVTFTYRGWLFE